MRPQLAKDDVGVDQTASLDVLFGVEQGLVERRAGRVVEPVAGIKGQQFDFRALGKVGRLVYHQSSGFYASLERHGFTLASEAVPCNRTALARPTSRVRKNEWVSVHAGIRSMRGVDGALLRRVGILGGAVATSRDSVSQRPFEPVREPVGVNDRGQKYAVRAILKAPAGEAVVVSVWFLPHGSDVPRFVTAMERPMSVHVLDVVVLNEDMPAQGLRRGDLGTIVEIRSTPLRLLRSSSSRRPVGRRRS